MEGTRDLQAHKTCTRGVLKGQFERVRALGEERGCVVLAVAVAVVECSSAREATERQQAGVSVGVAMVTVAGGAETATAATNNIYKGRYLHKHINK